MAAWHRLRTLNFGPPHLPFKTVRGNPGAGHSGGGWCGSTPATIHSYQPASCSPTGYSEARTFLTTSGLVWLRLSNTGNMFTLSELVVLMAVLSATASGYFVSIDAHAEECFYERVNSGTKMGLMFEVAEGGFLDIDVEVKKIKWNCDNNYANIGNCFFISCYRGDLGPC